MSGRINLENVSIRFRMSYDKISSSTQALAEIGRARAWSHLRWIVPETDQGAIALYERIAVRAPWRSYVLRLDPTGSL